MQRDGTEWFGHPSGLATLFFTEMWERFSYYGMRALLVLFMTDLVARGGLGMTDATATAIYGLYTFSVYAVALPGGWIADRLTGQRNAVLYGGIVIAAGHFTLAIPTLAAFYLGLLLIVLGTGLLKPNVSAIVGDLYPEGGARRDAGFSIYYMGINVGAFAGPLVCGYLGEEINWHLGFSAAGVGILLGVVQYVWGWGRLGEAGLLRAQEAGERARALRGLAGGSGALAAVAVVLAALHAAGALLQLAPRRLGELRERLRRDRLAVVAAWQADEAARRQRDYEALLRRDALQALQDLLALPHHALQRLCAPLVVRLVVEHGWEIRAQGVDEAGQVALEIVAGGAG